jgi:hypothetical protein
METLFASLPPLWQVIVYLTFLAFLVWNRTHSNKVSEAIEEVASLAFKTKLVVQKAAADAEVTAAAVTPNHGSSVADAVHRIESTLQDHTLLISNLTERLDQHILTDTPCDSHEPNTASASGVTLDQIFGKPDLSFLNVREAPKTT